MPTTVRRILLSAVLALLAPATAAGQVPDDWTSVQREVWDAVETRVAAWAEDDLDTFLAYTHDDWRRWARTSGRLMVKQDYLGFWDGMKAREHVLELRLESEAVEIYGEDQDAAVAHFVTRETIRWIGNATEEHEPGDVFTVVLRWSEFLVKRDGRWLTVGGHRDGICLLGDDIDRDPETLCAR